MRLSVLLVTALALLAPTQQTAPKAQDDVTHVVTLASRWTARFEQGLSGLLFRERYLQKIDGASLGTQGTISSRGTGRELFTEANVFLLRADATREFVLFRDVYSRNGRDIADHTQRLEKLLIDGTAKSFEQARRLTDASAANNVGFVTRNINIPTLAFRYLEASRIRSVQFRRAGEATVNGLPTAIVEFQEIGIPTLVRGRNDSDLPASGRYWIHPGSGAVVRAHVEFTALDVTGRMEVDLTLHGGLAAWGAGRDDRELARERPARHGVRAVRPLSARARVDRRSDQVSLHVDNDGRLQPRDS